MKKTILLTSLLASVATMAATSGSVEFYNKNETKYEKGNEFNASFRGTKTTTGVKTEVKVKDTGLTFGAEIKAKEYKLFAQANKTEVLKKLGHNVDDADQMPLPLGVKTIDALLNVRDNSSVWAKYELPELSGVMSYVKGTYKTKGIIEVEGDASYKLAEKLSAGLNSKTEFDFSKATGLSSDDVKSTHKLYLKGEYDKVKDIYAELGVQHSYAEKIAAKNVFLNVKASYEAMEGLTLTGKIDFKHNFNKFEMKDDSLLLDGVNIREEVKDDVPTKLEGIYRHSYLLGAKYTGVKDTELKLDAFIEHARISEEGSILNFGFKPEITYKGIENLVLSSKNILGGMTVYEISKTGTKSIGTLGFIRLNANAEYTYKVTDKFAVKPSLDLTANIITGKIKDSEGTYSELKITPKLSAEYKPDESLTISGDIAPSFMFSGERRENDVKEFGYDNTTVKSSLNVKYTW